MKTKNYKDTDILIYSIILILIILVLSILIFNIEPFTCGCIKIGKEIFGQFGEFFGGVFATIASILALVYIVLTFRNSKRDSDFELINEIFEKLQTDINSIQYRKTKTKKENDDETVIELKPNEQISYTGIDALYNFDKDYKVNPNSVLNHLNLILNSFDQLILLANKRIKFKHNDIKWLTIDRVYLLFYSKILWPVYEQIIDKHYSVLISENGHDDFKTSIANQYAKLSLDTIDYLSGGELNRLSKKELRKDNRKRPIKKIDIKRKEDKIEKLKEIE